MALYTSAQTWRPGCELRPARKGASRPGSAPARWDVPEAVPTAIPAANLEQNASHSKRVGSPGPHTLLSPPAGTARPLPTPGLPGSLLRKPRSLTRKKPSQRGEIRLGIRRSDSPAVDTHARRRGATRHVTREFYRTDLCQSSGFRRSEVQLLQSEKQNAEPPAAPPRGPFLESTEPPCSGPKEAECHCGP